MARFLKKDFHRDPNLTSLIDFTVILNNIVHVVVINKTKKNIYEIKVWTIKEFDIHVLKIVNITQK